MGILETIKTAGIVAAVIFVLLNLLELFLNKILYPRRARAHGCAPPYFYNARPLGLPLFYQAASSFIGHNVNEWLRTVLLSRAHTIRTTLMGMSGFITDDPENVKTILATSFKDFSLGWRYHMFFPLLGNGIFTLSGEGWKHSRAMLRPQFARDQVSHLESIKHHVDTLLERLGESADSGKLVDAQFLFHCLTIDTATEFLFGESTGTLQPTPRRVKGPQGEIDGNEFASAFGAAQETLAFRFMSTAFFWAVDGPGFRRNVAACHNFIDYFVYKALEKPMEKDEEAESYIFMRELTKETRDPVVIRDQALNILLAGRDTTASTMSFMAAYLSKHKDKYKKLREAVLADFGTDSSTITFESLKRCKYLNNVLNEVLRLNPIVAFNFRQAVRNTKLPTGGGPNKDQPVFIPSGSVVCYSPYSMHRSADYWGPDADQFIPERWDDVRGHGWEYLPFNGGPRICLGQQFALTEMGVTWVRICQTFENIDSELAFTDLERPKMQHRLTISVSGGVPSRWTRAENA